MINSQRRVATGFGAAVISLGIAFGLWAVFQPTESLTQDSPASSGIIAAARGYVDVEGGLSRVRTLRDGVVAEVVVLEGQAVKQGDVLGGLDRREADLAIRTAEAGLQQAKGQLEGLRAKVAAQARQVERLRRAAKGQAVSAQAVDEGETALAGLRAENAVAESAVSAAESRVETARYELTLRVFRAPVDGVVARRLVKPGDVVSAQALTELFTLIPNASRIVRAELQEQFVLLVHAGLEAEIISELDDRIRTIGKVIRVGRFLESRRSSESPGERVDVRTADCSISLPQDVPFLIGQRVSVRFKRASAP